MRKSLLNLLTIILFTTPVAAQEDAENCKDHPLFTRLPNFVIASCGTNFNAVGVHLTSQKTEEKEGNVTKIAYSFNSEGDTKKPPSPLQVIRNYENAILKNGGKKVYSSTGSDGYQGATFSFSKEGKNYWVTLDNLTPGLPDVVDGFELSVIEIEPMKQDIQATAIFEELNTKGSVALYINFETAKAAIKPDSEKIIEQVAQMLKDNATVKVSIEGHTQADNTGSPAANKVLSEQRAKAVMASLVSKGIAANRLSAKGWGQEKPIGDNKTEEGRAKNRRVEIVKM